MEKETNLWDLIVRFFNWIGNLFKMFCELLAKCVRLTFRKWWIVIPMMLIFLAMSLYYTRKDNKIYRADAIAVLNGPTVDMVQEAWNQLRYAMSPNVRQEQSLPSLLNLDWGYVNTLRGFESFYVIDLMPDSIADYVDYNHKFVNNDTLKAIMPNHIALRFRTKQPCNVSIIEDAIMNYLNSIPTFVSAYEARKTTIERQEKFYHDQVEKLDSLTSTFYFKEGVGYQTQFNRYENSLLIGKREIEIFVEDIENVIAMEKKVDKEYATCSAPVVLINHFTVCPKAYNGTLKYGVISLIIGWLIGLLIAFPIERRKEIKEWLEK